MNSHVNIYFRSGSGYNKPVNIRKKWKKRGVIMPSIKPISDLRNYTEVLKEVDARKRVYLTRNGHGAYAIMSIEEADELDRLSARYRLLKDLKDAEDESDRNGWIEAEELEKELEIYD